MQVANCCPGEVVCESLCTIQQQCQQYNFISTNKRQVIFLLFLKLNLEPTFTVLYPSPLSQTTVDHTQKHLLPELHFINLFTYRFTNLLSLRLVEKQTSFSFSLFVCCTLSTKSPLSLISDIWSLSSPSSYFSSPA